MPDKESTMKWKVDISQLKSGMQDAKRSISLANAEFKAATAGLDKWQDSITGVEAKIKQLNATSQSQDKILNDLKQQYEIVARELGATSPEAEKLAIQIKNQEAACTRTKAQIEQYNSRLEELKSSSVDSRNAAEKLTDKIAEQETKLKKLKTQYAAAVLEYGKNSTEAKGLAKEIKSLSGELSENKSKMSAAEKAADQFDKTVDNAGKSADKAAKGGFTVLKGALANLVSQGITLAVKGLKDLTSEIGNLVKEGAAYSDTINTQSVVTGIAVDKLQEYYYMTDLVDVSVDTLTGSMSKLTRNMSTARKGSGDAYEAFKKLKVPIEDVNGNLRDNEDVFNDVITALGGIENETERDALAMAIFGKSAQELNPLIAAGGERIAELTKEAHEMGAVLSEESMTALNDVQDSLDRMGQSTSAVKRQFAAAAAPIVKEFLNPLTKAVTALPDAFRSGDYSVIITLVIGALMGLFTQATGYLPKFAEIGLGVLTQILLSLMQNAPQLVSVGFLLIQSLLSGLSSGIPQILAAIPSMLTEVIGTLTGEGLPMLLQSGIGFIMAILDGIKLMLPALLAQLPVIIEMICGFLIDSLPLVLDAGLQLLMSIVSAIPIFLQSLQPALPKIINTITSVLIQSTPILLKAAIQLLMAIIDAFPTILRILLVQTPEIVNTICTSLLDNLPLLIQAAVQLFFGILEAIPQVCIELGRQLPTIISAIVEGLGAGWSSIKDAGVNLISGLWEGISGSYSWIKEKITGWVGNVVDFMKDLFGIHSPSTLMANEIGRFLPGGIVKGNDSAMPQAKRDLQKSVNSMVAGLKADLDFPIDVTPKNPRSGGVGSAGMVRSQNITFNQYNNSPKALDRLTVYRQTNSLLFSAKVRLADV